MSDEQQARRQRIQWWRDAKYGMFIHWGLYAIPAGQWGEKKHERGYSEWIMFGEKIPVAEYAALATQFNPTGFDATQWVDLAQQAGMKYLVLTTKHHDGFAMFDSQVTDYTVVKATPWQRDPTRELADACRAAGLKFGCYYSTDRDWYRPTGPGNRYNQTNTWDYPDATQQDFDRYIETLVKPQVEELLRLYAPDLIWFDEIDMKSDEQVRDIYNMIRRIKPDCIINSRLKGCTFPQTIPPPRCDFITSGDNEILENDPDFEWENPGSMNSSFGYNQFDHNWLEPGKIVSRLVNIVSRRGNYLLNVGPSAEGLIPQPSATNLKRAGDWLAINGQAIYGSSPWRVAREQRDGVDICFSAKGDCIYAICLSRPGDELVIESLAGESGITDVTLVGSDASVDWTAGEAGLRVSMRTDKPDELAFVLRISTS
jgi:alpha-L-fucosidase